MITWKKLNKCHSCFVILTKFVLREYPKQSRITLTKLNFSLWLVQKTCTNLSTNLGHSHFPAFQAVWVLIDPWSYKLWLWVVVGNAKWLWFFNPLLKTAVSHAFNPLTEWPKQNFSLQYQYNINQINVENKEKYQFGHN